MFSGSKQKSLFDYLHYYISLLIFLNFQKLESDLDVARVEVGHAMGVHTRAKAALMAGLGKKNIENSRSKMGFVTRSIPRSPSNTSLFKYPIGRSVLPHHLLVFSFDPFNIFNRRNYDREGVSL